MCNKEIDYNRENEFNKTRDFNKENYEAKKKMDVYMGITPEIQQKLLDSVQWNLKMVERTILKQHYAISPKRGDIWLVDLGVNVGAEMNKERPCVVVSYDEYNDKSGLTTIIPITRAKYSHLTQFVVSNDYLSSVYDKLEGTVKAEQITTKSKLRFKAKIGELNSDGLKLLNIALINHLGLVDYCSQEIKEYIYEQRKQFEEEYNYEDNLDNESEIIEEDNDLIIEIPEGIEYE